MPTVTVDWICSACSTGLVAVSQFTCARRYHVEEVVRNPLAPYPIFFIRLIEVPHCGVCEEKMSRRFCTSVVKGLRSSPEDEELHDVTCEPRVMRSGRSFNYFGRSSCGRAGTLFGECRRSGSSGQPRKSFSGPSRAFTTRGIAECLDD